VHGLDVEGLVARLSAKPRIRVEGGVYVGWIGGEGYELGSTKAGLAGAIRRMRELRWEALARAA
jgi:hypothetical protein